MPLPARAAPLALSAIALLASGVARAAEPTAQDLLRRMSESLRRADYEGSFIYQQDGRTDALRIFHRGGERERERLVSLTGARNEIVRDDRTVTCFQNGVAPTEFTLRNEKTGLLPLAPNVRELGADYSVALAGSDRVAGYEASVVDIVPRDPYRYGYRLWVAHDTSLLLRSAIVDAKRQPLAQFMFVALDVGSKPSDADLASAATLTGAVSADGDPAVSSKPEWHVDVPAGFRLVRTERAGNAALSEQLVYSDGVASVSIYVEPHADAKAAETAKTESTIIRGTLSIHSRDADGVRVTALGDVPPATVQSMAKSVRAIASR